MVAQHRDPRPTRRFALALTMTTCALMAAGATPAGAASVAVTASPFFGSTTFTDTANEVNTVTLSQDGTGQLIFTDTTTPPVDGDGPGGCTVSGNVATCPAPAPDSFDVTVSAGANDDTITMSDTVSTPARASGGDGNDTLNGSARADVLFGDNGNDNLSGNGGDDVLAGGIGDPFFFVGPGDDGDDKLSGGAGKDALSGGSGNDTIDGGPGDDNIPLFFGLFPSGLDGGPGNDTVSGGDGEDSLTGGSGDDTVNGDAGNDRVNTGDGIDTVNGGAGDDELSQSDQEQQGSFPATLDGDTFNGDAGDDTMVYERVGGVTVTANDNLANDGAPGEHDNVRDSVENIAGGSGDDNLTGNGGANELRGGGGNDALYGLGGSDALFGDIGNDTITGGADRDELRGERGDDTLLSNDSGPDQVGCGAGVDSVTNDSVDTVDGDCESVSAAVAVGPAGPPGPAGTPGPSGPAGATGARGPAGRTAKITVSCKLTGRKKKTIKCTTKSAAAARGASVRLRLSHKGRVVASGSGRLRGGESIVDLRLRRSVQGGRYTLTALVAVRGGKTRTLHQRIDIR
ncbi:MAG: hypothetical protein QOD83_1768 [Solirubrobacteraceae bacterium]|jgi:Ca2+-binding RTX toxin-like protein|nr:hypothetical protein [Solirubrobacteraceae bacterium]